MLSLRKIKYKIQDSFDDDPLRFIAVMAVILSSVLAIKLLTEMLRHIFG